MAKDNSSDGQLNLTVVALVAIVALVGLVALVFNTRSLAEISTGGQFAVAQDVPSDVPPAVDGEPVEDNVVGEKTKRTLVKMN